MMMGNRNLLDIVMLFFKKKYIQIIIQLKSLLPIGKNVLWLY